MLQAYHAGIVDTLLYQNANTELPYNVTVAEFIELIADLENKVDGVADAQGIVTMSNGQEVANLVRISAACMPWPACLRCIHRTLLTASLLVLQAGCCLQRCCRLHT